MKEKSFAFKITRILFEEIPDDELIDWHRYLDLELSKRGYCLIREKFDCNCNCFDEFGTE